LGVWDYLINVKESEILSLPVNTTNTDNCNIPQEAKWLIRFWFNAGKSRPSRNASVWAKSSDNFWGEKTRYCIARQLRYIRHWKIYNKSYETIPNEKATWFIDPPYKYTAGMDKKYTHSKKIDYNFLSKWCRNRNGQIIVCEEENADWLEFSFFKKAKTISDKIGTEVVWTNKKNIREYLK
jgi:16S rRNA G966 N2-methylase RsmD